MGKKSYGRRLTQEVIATITNFPPGQSYSGYLLVSLLDSYGQIVSSDSNSTATLSQADNSTSVSGTIKFTCSNGTFNLTNFIVSGSPGSTQLINLTTTAVVPYFKYTTGDNQTYYSTVQIQISFRSCTYGEIISNTSCTVCPAGKYLINPSDSCISCPTGAYCAGGSNIYPLSGY